jgi:hypothetical protein
LYVDYIRGYDDDDDVDHTTDTTLAVVQQDLLVVDNGIANHVAVSINNDTDDVVNIKQHVNIRMLKFFPGIGDEIIIIKCIFYFK